MKKIKTTIIIVIAIVLVTTLAGCAIKIMLEGNAGGGSSNTDSEVISATESKSESVSESEEVSESTEKSESEEQNSDNEMAALEFEHYVSYDALQRNIWYRIENPDSDHAISLTSKDGSVDILWSYNADKKVFEERDTNTVDISGIITYVYIDNYTYIKFTGDVSTYCFCISGNPNSEHKVYVQIFNGEIEAAEFEQYKSFTVLQKDIWYKIDNTDTNHSLTLCSKDGSSKINYDYSKDKKLFEVRTAGGVEIFAIPRYVNIGDYTYVKFTDDVSAYVFSIVGAPNTEYRVYVQKTA